MNGIQGLKCIYSKDSGPLGLPPVLLSCHPAEIENNINRIWPVFSEGRDIVLFYEDSDSYISPTELRHSMSEMQMIVIPVTENYINWRMNLMKRVIKAAPLSVRKLMLLMDGFSKDKAEEFFRDIRHKDIFDFEERENLNAYLNRAFDDDKPVHIIREVFDTYVKTCLKKYEPEYLDSLDLISSDNKFYLQYLSWCMAERQRDPDLTYALQQTEKYLSYGAQKLRPATFAEMTEADHERIRDIALKDVTNDPVHTFFTGLAFQKGYGVKADRDEAVRRLRQSLEEGFSKAEARLKDL